MFVIFYGDESLVLISSILYFLAVSSLYLERETQSFISVCAEIEIVIKNVNMMSRLEATFICLVYHGL